VAPWLRGRPGEQGSAKRSAGAEERAGSETVGSEAPSPGGGPRWGGRPWGRDRFCDEDWRSGQVRPPGVGGGGTLRPGVRRAPRGGAPCPVCGADDLAPGRDSGAITMQNSPHRLVWLLGLLLGLSLAVGGCTSGNNQASDRGSQAPTAAPAPTATAEPSSGNGAAAPPVPAAPSNPPAAPAAPSNPPAAASPSAGRRPGATT